jgi:predicted PurR-regulated permease PerM
VLNAVFGALSVLIMTLYFLAALPSMKRQAYRLVPATRRERVTLLGDEILSRIGGYLSGAFVVAFIATLTSYVFLLVIGMPYALALAIFVGLLDLIPLIGATIAAVVVSLVGFTESVTLGLACVAFYVAYQQFENYVIYPRVMRRAVDVPAPLTVVAALIGGALLGVVGALLAIPTAAAVLLIVRQVAIPRMDRV